MNKRKVTISLLAVVLGGILVNYYLLPVSKTFAVITILDKHQSEEDKGYVVAAPPNADGVRKEEKTKIFVEEHMVWNLIEKDKTYFVTYETKRNGESFLKEIKSADK
jgi:hypothetical protein